MRFCEPQVDGSTPSGGCARECLSGKGLSPLIHIWRRVAWVPGYVGICPCLSLAGEPPDRLRERLVKSLHVAPFCDAGYKTNQQYPTDGHGKSENPPWVATVRI